MKNSAQFNIVLNSKNIYGRTAFHYTCINGHLAVAKILMKRSKWGSSKNKIDLNAKDKWGKTGFHHACENGRTETVQMLIKNATTFLIDLKDRDKSGKNALQIAECFQKSDVVNIIKSELPSIGF